MLSKPSVKLVWMVKNAFSQKQRLKGFFPPCHIYFWKKVKPNPKEASNVRTFLFFYLILFLLLFHIVLHLLVAEAFPVFCSPLILHCPPYYSISSRGCEMSILTFVIISSFILHLLEIVEKAFLRFFIFSYFIISNS